MHCVVAKSNGEKEIYLCTLLLSDQVEGFALFLIRIHFSPTLDH